FLTHRSQPRPCSSFLPLRLPPTSPLFPYTTLFRSSPAIANSGTGIGLSLTKGLVELHHGAIKVESNPNHETTFVILIPIDKEVRSEEHTSELQSRENLVCRLLLEKKKKNNKK